MTYRLTHLWWRDSKGLTDLSIKLPHVTEALYAACGAAMGELRVKDEARPHAAGWWRQTFRCGTFSQTNTTYIQAIHAGDIETPADGFRFLILN